MRKEGKRIGVRRIERAGWGYIWCILQLYKK